MKLMWSQIAGLPIVLEDTGEKLGRLNGLFMGPEDGRIVAYLVGVTRVLAPVDIRKWMASGVHVSDPEALTSPFELLRLEKYGLRRCFVHGKRVLSKSGRFLGKVRDLQVDTQTHSMLHFEVSKRFLWLEWNRRQFSFHDVSEVTERAILLKIEPESMQKERRGKAISAPV